MLKFNLCLWLALLATCLVAGSAAGSFIFTSPKSVEIIDSSNADISGIAAVVCQVTKGVHKQISRTSTIGKLINYLEGQNNLCKEQYLESLVELQKVISTGNSDVCGQDKIQAIEDFHRRYVTTVSKHQGQRKSIPKVVKLFFLHYATLISSKCEQSAHQLLLEASDLLQKEEYNMEEALTSFAHSLRIEDIKPQFDDVYLVWNLVENLPLEKSEKFARNVQTGPEKVFIEMKDPDNLARFHSICSKRLRPLYVNTILPVVRLVDIGYYPKSDLLMKKISSDPVAKRLYLSAQFCETLLPVQLVRNAKLEAHQMHLVPLEEAKKISERLTARMEVQRVLQSGENSFEGVDELESITSDDVKSETKLIKERVRSRGKVGVWALTKLAGAIKSKLASSSKKVSITNRDGSHENIEEAVSEMANGKVDIEVNHEDDEDDDETGLSRVTRGSEKKEKKRERNVFWTIMALPFFAVFAFVVGVLVVIFGCLVELPLNLIFKKSVVPVQHEEAGLTWSTFSIDKKGIEKARLKALAKKQKKEAEEKKED